MFRSISLESACAFDAVFYHPEELKTDQQKARAITSLANGIVTKYSFKQKFYEEDLIAKLILKEFNFQGDLNPLLNVSTVSFTVIQALKKEMHTKLASCEQEIEFEQRSMNTLRSTEGPSVSITGIARAYEKKNQLKNKQSILNQLFPAN